MKVHSMGRVTRFVSEFAVIVVGVLAALSVDSLRENQTDRGLERRYLEQIVADSRQNLRLLAVRKTPVELLIHLFQIREIIIIDLIIRF